MAQLIKLQDYPSRYENDMYYYPSQYVSLKKEQWKRISDTYESDLFQEYRMNILQEEEYSVVAQTEKKGFISSMFERFKKKEIIQEEELKSDPQDQPFYYVREFFLQYNPSSAEALQKSYQRFMFQLQMKWASSLVGQKPMTDAIVKNSSLLRHFLTKLPDNYFVMYRPVFHIGSAPVEAEIIIISPVATWCITCVDGDSDSTFVARKGNFWVNKSLRHEQKIINPMHASHRMGKIVQSIYRNKQIDMPIRHILLARDGYIDYPSPPIDVEIIDKRNVNKWYESLRQLSSPIKFQQLKAAQALLDTCKRTVATDQEEGERVEER
ncbi:hypothetical protein [Priestia taiwanensis]|uniref:NERD domain-containing protein n=1 Tax=Priestia taiwanensis TaxID=1347902 RepID=A0A917AWD6_9BACI|nr:hypothetical protein [Priestia taiwanensis]MBM7363383.1 hypothetical protein [Priestia taiwanensis]GGE77612.1 hypothetical protein GCM10007140_29080 [Priestia taiwanensis]